MNSIKLGENFNIADSDYDLHNPYHITKDGNKYELLDNESHANSDMLVELLSDISHAKRIKPKKWVPEIGEDYYLIDPMTGNVACHKNGMTAEDLFTLKNVLYFQTEEECARHKEIMDYIDQHFII